jgi:uncharacterized protein YndB with AHSA1/START domain
MNQATLPAVVIRRTFEASPDRVFAAWTGKEFAEMICPKDVKLQDLNMDVRPGGSYKMDLLMPDGDVWTLHGDYREVTPPRRLAMTWSWIEDDPKDAQETLLTIELTPEGSGTALELRHELFQREESRASHEEGWASGLDKLAAMLSATSW